MSGPGVLHGLAGLGNARINTWPMIMLSGSTATANVGKGGFQVRRPVDPSLTPHGRSDHIRRQLAFHLA